MDITLTTDVLKHAYQGNYDTLVLVAGDGDYIPLVEEVRRRGKAVYLSFLAGARGWLQPRRWRAPAGIHVP